MVPEKNIIAIGEARRFDRWISSSRMSWCQLPIHLAAPRRDPIHPDQHESSVHELFFCALCIIYISIYLCIYIYTYIYIYILYDIYCIYIINHNIIYIYISIYVVYCSIILYLTSPWPWMATLAHVGPWGV